VKLEDDNIEPEQLSQEEFELAKSDFRRFAELQAMKNPYYRQQKEYDSRKQLPKKVQKKLSFMRKYNL
jgi:hypothetical protein